MKKNPYPMTIHTCKKCGKHWKLKGDYTRHINRKISCDDKTIEEKIKNIVKDEVKNELAKLNNKDNIINAVMNCTICDGEYPEGKHHPDCYSLDFERDLKQMDGPEFKDKSKLGQYFTTDITLRTTVASLIMNNDGHILEPSVGQGDLVQEVLKTQPNRKFDMYEIDDSITPLEGVGVATYGDFLNTKIVKKYSTIIGNPPYVRTTKGNLYLDFIKKCFGLLNDGGELIFVVPSDVFKLTSASKLWVCMMKTGAITHIYHPHNENMFKNATIDVLIFRYKQGKVGKTCMYNNTITHIQNDAGLITFSSKPIDGVLVHTMFNVYVGLVSGKEDIYRSDLGNIEVLVKKNHKHKYIHIDKYPCEDDKINKYLLDNKDILMTRKIKKFNDSNWYEWGAPRNIKIMKKKLGAPCIYIYNLTREKEIAWVGNVQMFGGNIIMLIPKKGVDLFKIVQYLNLPYFKKKFTQSGRFKIGQRHLLYSRVDHAHVV
jgi:adenine-specific DNA-methyltransferase